MNIIPIWSRSYFDKQVSTINETCDVSSIGNTLVLGIPEGEQVSRVCNASYSDISEFENSVSRIGDTPYLLCNLSRIG